MEISGLRSRIINSRNAPFNIFKQFKTEIISPLKKNLEARNSVIDL